jgi:lipopolysaccharide biosynthesis regulator YciM
VTREEKEADKVRCPSCGFVLEFLDWRCPECYHEFSEYEFFGDDED